MRTRYKSYPFNSNATIPRRSNKRRVKYIVEPEIRTIKEIISMADRTMEELLQAPTEGYGEAIIISEILAENFEIKMNLLQLVQTNKFHGFERDNPHTHISNFKRMTTTLKYRDVLNDAIKLMLFPYSLEGAARIWYEKEPPNLILTWDDIVNKCVNQFFPPSKITHLKNEISRFTQRFEETLGEAWERFKEMLRACPHHGFSELTQIDMFYNGLNEQDQDSLNAAVGGNVLSKTTREELKIIKNKSKVRYSRSKSNVSRVNTNSRDNVSKIDDRIDKVTDQILNLVEIVNKQVITPATAKVEENLRRNLNNDMRSILGGFFQNQASTLGTLWSNTVPNLKGEMKVVTTRSGLPYERPSIPTNSPLEKKNLSLPELTPTWMTLDLADRSITRHKGVAEDVFVKAYENSVIYKERTKKLHDYKIKNRIFNVGDQVLLFNSRLKIFSGKLKTRWPGPFTITQVIPYGTVELSQPNGPNFKVNGHRVKHYFGGDIPSKTSGQVEVSNRGLKRILERTVGENHASWSNKLDDALWAFRTAFKTLIGYNPYKLFYGKLCHLSIELEHRAYWALKHVNFNLKTTGDHRKL
nr:reverse transcriptase domain-containing protein [Tanacetum cinerariifolium]